MDFKSQKDMVREHLGMFGYITDKQAEELYGCNRLAARISDLRHHDGMGIKTKRKYGTNRFGKKVPYSVYVLED